MSAAAASGPPGQRSDPLPWLLSVHGVVIFSGWWHGVGSEIFTGDGASAMLAIGQGAGLVLATLALFQLVLMSRAPWLERIYGLDGLVRIHHRVGQVFLVPLIAHPLLITAAHGWRDGESLVTEYGLLLQMDGIVGATIAICLFLGILVYSIVQPYTSWNYQWWYAAHLAMYAAVLLAFWHQVALGGSLQASSLFSVYWWLVSCLALVAVVVYRVATPVARLRRHRFVVDAIVPETRNVTSVFITGRDLDSFRFESGQFVVVRFLCRRLFWEAHPYSLSLPYDGKRLRLTVKNIGDFSGAVRDVLPGTRVLLEGPYGIFTSARATGPKVLGLAFGIGITPIRAIAEDLLKAGRDMVLIYGSVRTGDIALKQEVDALSARYGMQVHHVISEESLAPLPMEGSLAPVTVSSGFVTRDLLERVVPDITERDVFLCGPPIVMQMLRTDLTALGVPGSRIFSEQFSLH